jgi:hypothetical protein
MINVLIELGKLRDKQAKRVANAVISNASKEAIAREQKLLDEINVALMMHAKIVNATGRAETLAPAELG